jgi:rare lipoprotein A
LLNSWVFSKINLVLLLESLLRKFVGKETFLKSSSIPFNLMKYLASLLLFVFFSVGLFAQYESGYALYYADYLDGRQTASGEIFSQRQLTCAHKTHPFGTLLKVTRQDNGMSVIVRVNDRGPFCDGCSVDLSRIAAERIELIKPGKKMVHVQVVGFSNTNPKVLNTWSEVTGRPSKNYETTRANTSQPRNEKLTAKGKAAPPAAPKTTPRSYDAPAQPRVADAESRNIKYLPLGQTGYFIQLGAFTQEVNAKRTIIDLQRKGLKYLYLQKGQTRPNEPIIRLFLGPFKTQSEANKYLRDVCPRFGVTGIVVLLH